MSKRLRNRAPLLRILLACLALAATGAVLAGCGGSAKSSEPGGSELAAAGTTSEEPGEAEAKRVAAELKRRLARSEAATKARHAALLKAAEAEEAEEAAKKAKKAKKGKGGKGAKGGGKAGAGKGPTKTTGKHTTQTPAESAAEQQARSQFAREEAAEVKAAQKAEREEARRGP